MNLYTSFFFQVEKNFRELDRTRVFDWFATRFEVNAAGSARDKWTRSMIKHHEVIDRDSDETRFDR